MENEIRTKNTPEMLMRELQRLRVSHTPENIVQIGRQRNGKIVFLEIGIGGNNGRGLVHILEEHSAEFRNQGIPESGVPELILRALTQGRSVAKQGSRDVFEADFQGQTRYIAITVGDNGYIVGANPVGRRTLQRLLRHRE